MKRVIFAVLIAALSILPLSHAIAAPKPVTTAFTLVDAGVFNFLSQSSALLDGDGFDKLGLGLNTKVESDGSFDLLGPATKCANGFIGRLVGTVTEPSGSTINYTIDNQLCPTEVANVYSASGTYKITSGTGKYIKAKGVGIFEGLADFAAAKYKCLLVGVINY